MASCWKILLLLSLFETQQCVSSHPFAAFSEESEMSTVKPLQVNISSNESAPKKTGRFPIEREHWAIVCSVIALCFALITIFKYMCCPYVRCCGCKEVELQRTRDLQNRELKPQYSWEATNHI
ncbi:uncharacterized protein LOC128863285 [Anastrepha ludens]|uniref:uncharacterized protein LOC128863285 n=1 Tax=Anastrepha ludens TaxID=28586 RepID=UPI0023AF01C9|nr:uncharacterized protein LOC128863285 [Anastrepha ludens]